ncbi:MAG: hypothetical protein HGA78_08400 [Nitrospirales bacterium]|nr:hypothetical protein [Nitrospirales bacterium]
MQIHETISVIASFGQPYRLRPLRFRWSGRLIDVKEITYTWKTQEGQNDIYHFSVSDSSSIYELSFNTSSLLWSLESLET